jgi:hypothetical protein
MNGLRGATFFALEGREIEVDELLVGRDPSSVLPLLLLLLLLFVREDDNDGVTDTFFDDGDIIPTSDDDVMLADGIDDGAFINNRR